MVSRLEDRDRAPFTSSGSSGVGPVGWVQPRLRLWELESDCPGLIPSSHSPLGDRGPYLALGFHSVICKLGVIIRPAQSCLRSEGKKSLPSGWNFAWHAR